MFILYILACTFGPYIETSVYMTTPTEVKSKRSRKHHLEFKRLGGGDSGFVHTCEERIDLYINGEAVDYFHGESLEQSWSLGRCPNLTYQTELSPKGYFLGYLVNIEHSKDIRQIPLPEHYEIHRDIFPDMDKLPIPFEFTPSVIDWDNLGNLPTEEEWVERETEYEAYLLDDTASVDSP